MSTPQQQQDHIQPQMNQPQPAYQTKAEQVQQEQQQNAQPSNGPPPNYHQNHVAAMPLQMLGPSPAIIDCPFCNHRVPTRVVEDNSSMTYLLGVLIGCICICAACVPCMAGMCQDVTHFCSGCGQRVAHIPYSGGVQVLAPPLQGGPAGQYAMGPLPVYGGTKDTTTAANTTAAADAGAGAGAGAGAAAAADADAGAGAPAPQTHQQQQQDQSQPTAGQPPNYTK